MVPWVTLPSHSSGVSLCLGLVCFPTGKTFSQSVFSVLNFSPSQCTVCYTLGIVLTLLFSGCKLLVGMRSREVLSLSWCSLSFLVFGWDWSFWVILPDTEVIRLSGFRISCPLLKHKNFLSFFLFLLLLFPLLVFETVYKLSSNLSQESDLILSPPLHLQFFKLCLYLFVCVHECMYVKVKDNLW